MEVHMYQNFKKCTEIYKMVTHLMNSNSRSYSYISNFFYFILITSNKLFVYNNQLSVCNNDEIWYNETFHQYCKNKTLPLKRYSHYFIMC